MIRQTSVRNCSLQRKEVKEEAVTRAVALALGLVLASCATAPAPQWTRTDGRAPSETDLLACKGETQKAALATTTEPGIACDSSGCFGVHTRALNDVMAGCMAGRGYLQR